ncbi:MAG: hypothetical protein V4695_10180 [Pseudomonadota bacterium]
MYATFLGLARPLAWKYSLVEFLTPYLLLLVCVFVTFYPVVSRSTRKLRQSGLEAAGSV